MCVQLVTTASPVADFQRRVRLAHTQRMLAIHQSATANLAPADRIVRALGSRRRRMFARQAITAPPVRAYRHHRHTSVRWASNARRTAQAQCHVRAARTRTAQDKAAASPVAPVTTAISRTMHAVSESTTRCRRSAQPESIAQPAQACLTTVLQERSRMPPVFTAYRNAKRAHLATTALHPVSLLRPACAPLAGIAPEARTARRRSTIQRWAANAKLAIIARLVQFSRFHAQAVTTVTLTVLQLQRTSATMDTIVHSEHRRRRRRTTPLVMCALLVITASRVQTLRLLAPSARTLRLSVLRRSRVVTCVRPAAIALSLALPSRPVLALLDTTVLPARVSPTPQAMSVRSASSAP